LRAPTGRYRGSPASAWAAEDFRDTLDNDDQRHQERKILSEPISSERFAVLIRTVRRPRDRAAEPAHIFVQPRV